MHGSITPRYPELPAALTESQRGSTYGGRKLGTLIKRSRAWLHYARADRSAAQQADPLVIPLISYPKVGRTWLSFMLAELFKRHFALEVERLTIKIHELDALDPRIPKVRVNHDNSAFMDEAGNRYDLQELFIYGGRQRYRNSRVMLMVRDPRDVVTSLYHQATKRSVRPIEIASLSEFVRHPYYGIDSVVRFYQIWYRNRKVPRDLLLLRYEDLLTSGVGELSRVSKFLGLEASDETLSKVVEISSADNLRSLERAGKVEDMRLFSDDPNALKVRKARTATYKEELEPEDIAFCNRKMANFPTWYGYSEVGVTD